MMGYHTCYVPLFFRVLWFVYVYFVINLVIEYFPQTQEVSYVIALTRLDSSKRHIHMENRDGEEVIFI